MGQQDSEGWVGAVQVATHLGVSKSWVEKAAVKGGLPSVKVGRNRRFRLSAVDQWAENRPPEG